MCVIGRCAITSATSRRRSGGGRRRSTRRWRRSTTSIARAARAGRRSREELAQTAPRALTEAEQRTFLRFAPRSAAPSGHWAPNASRTPSAARRSAHPADGGHLELMEARFSHVRSFAPQILGALTFAASVAPSEILGAVELLQTMNAEGCRHVLDDAPTGFIAARWWPYLDAAREDGNEKRFKHYWELCVLLALQGGCAQARSGHGVTALRQPGVLPDPTGGLEARPGAAAQADRQARHIR